MMGRVSASQQKTLLQAMLDIEGVLGRQTELQIRRGLKPARNDKIEESVSGTIRLRSGHPGSRALPDQNLRSAPGEGRAYDLRPHRPGDMGWVVQRHGELYWKEYRYDERFEALVAAIVAEFIKHFDPKRERCWIAEKDGERVGAIFLVKKSNIVAKLRLLLVEPDARGLGIGRRLVSECVSFAREAGYKKVHLWTQRELHAARHLYEEAVFKRIERKPHQSWGRKDLVAETWELNL